MLRLRTARQMRELTENLCPGCFKESAAWNFEEDGLVSEDSPRELLSFAFSASSSRLRELEHDAEFRILTTDARGKYVLRFSHRAGEVFGCEDNADVLEYIFHRRQKMRFEIRVGEDPPSDFLETDLAPVVIAQRGRLKLHGVNGVVVDYSTTELLASKQHVLLKFGARNLATEGLLCWCRPPLTRISVLKDGARIRSTDWCRARNPSWLPVTIPLTDFLPPLASGNLAAPSRSTLSSAPVTSLGASRSASTTATVTATTAGTATAGSSRNRRRSLENLGGVGGCDLPLSRCDGPILLVCHGPFGTFRLHPHVAAHTRTDLTSLLTRSCPVDEDDVAVNRLNARDGRGGDDGAGGCCRAGVSTSAAADSVKRRNREPRIVVEQCRVLVVRSFYERLCGGLRIRAFYCVDFSHYNGSRSNPFSLHYTDGCWPSPYEATLTALTSVLRSYNPDGTYRLFGFGVDEHDFCVESSRGPGVCVGVEGVLQSYRECSSQVPALGTPYFASVLRRCWSVMAGERRKLKARIGRDNDDTSLNYYVIVVLTAGVIADFQETINALLSAAALPVSVRVVMMGSGYCKQLFALSDAVTKSPSTERSIGVGVDMTARSDSAAAVDDVSVGTATGSKYDSGRVIRRRCRLGVAQFRDTFSAGNSIGDTLDDDAYANRLTRMILSEVPNDVAEFFSCSGGGGGV